MRTTAIGVYLLWLQVAWQLANLSAASVSHLIQLVTNVWCCLVA